MVTDKPTGWVTIDPAPWNAWNQTFVSLSTSMQAMSTAAATADQVWRSYNTAWTTIAGTSSAITYSMPATITWASTTFAEETYWAGWNNTYTATRWSDPASDPVADMAAMRDRYGRAHEQLVRDLSDTEYQAMRDRAERAQAERAVRYAQQVEQRQREQAEREAERAAAQAVAHELLLAHLDAQQKRDLLEHNWFEVISDKGRRWRIRAQGMSGNVDLMPERGDARLASYCAHAAESMPISDHHLVQKLVLEADEDQFTQVANLQYRADHAPADIPDRHAIRAVA